MTELRTAKAWGLTPEQWFINEPIWSREMMIAYEIAEAEISAARAYDDNKKMKRKK